MKRKMEDKKKVLRQTEHLTRPPRLQPMVKNAMMDKVLKKKKERDETRPDVK